MRILLWTTLGKGGDNLITLVYTLFSTLFIKVFLLQFTYSDFTSSCFRKVCHFVVVPTCSGVPASKNLGLHASTPTCKAKVFFGDFLDSLII